MNVLDLFSGIGGFSLGLERAGMRTVAFCEIDPYCRRVLARHWPDVPVFGDVRELTAQALADAFGMRQLQPKGREQDQWQRSGDCGVDIICGGFPCQDISLAGKGVGIDGERSGLWSEYARIIGEVRPGYVIIENVSALLGRGLSRVLGDLAALGYDAEWHCIPASAVGAPHRRDRLWIVANSRGGRRGEPSSGEVEQSRRTKAIRPDNALAHSNYQRELQSQGSQQVQRGRPGYSGEDVADAERGRLQGRHVQLAEPPAIIPSAFSWHCGGSEFGAPWQSEPDVGRVAYGVPSRVDRLRALGNAIVPQISEIIGRAIMKADQMS